jgi:hypothetical protein
MVENSNRLCQTSRTALWPPTFDISFPSTSQSYVFASAVRSVATIEEIRLEGCFEPVLCDVALKSRMSSADGFSSSANR